MKTKEDAKQCLLDAWPYIVSESRTVLGSELHYQAMVYHCLRAYGNAPIDQIGMNVKMWISSPVTELFRSLDARKHQNFRGGFEPIPDVCLFSPEISGDWRRRNNHNTLQSLLLAIEVKASERKGGRLRTGEIIGDIKKLAAHREEAEARNTNFFPVMMVIDTAPGDAEKMTGHSLSQSEAAASDLGVGFLYVAPDSVRNSLVPA